MESHVGRGLLLTLVAGGHVMALGGAWAVQPPEPPRVLGQQVVMLAHMDAAAPPRQQLSQAAEPADSVSEPAVMTDSTRSVKKQPEHPVVKPETVRPVLSPTATPRDWAPAASAVAAVEPDPHPAQRVTQNETGAPQIPDGFDAAYLANPKPPYPLASRRLGEEGRVLLRVYVDARGLPGQIELEHSSGFTRLDQAALEGVGRWKFVPAHRGGISVAAWLKVPVIFKLEQ